MKRASRIFLLSFKRPAENWTADTKRKSTDEMPLNIQRMSFVHVRSGLHVLRAYVKAHSAFGAVLLSVYSGICFEKPLFGAGLYLRNLPPLIAPNFLGWTQFNLPIFARLYFCRLSFIFIIIIIFSFIFVKSRDLI